jgi:hypothetical protein
MMTDNNSSTPNLLLIQVLYEITDQIAESRSRLSDQQLISFLRARGLHDEPDALNTARSWAGSLYRVVILNSLLPQTLQQLEESGVPSKDARAVLATLTGAEMESAPEKSQDEPAPTEDKRRQPQPEPAPIKPWDQTKAPISNQPADTVKPLPSHQPKRQRKTKLWLAILGILALLGIGITAALFWPRSPIYPGGVYFMSDRDGSWEIYHLNNGKLTQVTNTPDNRNSKNPSLGWDGVLYFSSNRDGKMEIYRLNNSGTPERMTFTDGLAESYLPAICMDNHLYFTSNRTGQANIFYIGSNSISVQVTQTGGAQFNLDPACRLSSTLYFSSSRTGTFEIYRLTSQGLEQFTTTPNNGYSVQPAVGARGEIYFTSNREGKREIYIVDQNGTRQLTNTDKGESWGPVVNQRGELYFTSDRDSKPEVYFYNLDGVPIRLTYTEGLAFSKTR